jgi:GH15 family glucan-1,4-alpha-glucosidase
MVNLHQSSIDIIRSEQAASGAYPACSSFSQYGYSWLRDGTWIAYAMDCAGQHNSARDFHRWAAHTLLRYGDKVTRMRTRLAKGKALDESDYLPTRFNLDGSLGSDAWGDFQLDGYGAWLWGVSQPCAAADITLWEEVRPAVELVVRYLEAVWQSPNYDCWEEFQDQVHTATLAAMYGGLTSVHMVDAAIVPDGLTETIRDYTLEHCIAADGHFMKYLGNDTVDASLLWVTVPYQLVSVKDARFQTTLAKIERDLLHPDGGVYRYRADTYYGGGEWLLLTAWLGWVYVELGRVEEARRLFDWIEAQALPNGKMPEQVSEHLLNASYYPGWEAKWGKSACPLLWSHAMYLILEARLKEAGA